ncbi:MAG: ADP-forming succinate--CoA ligase subunit beta [Kofleriaceae bacterium]|nr:ADP-forming succinate--CoA ligase subunit beta [Kofleriaceae bacterium]
MKIHEYQAKELLRAHDVPVPRGYAAFTEHEAVEAAQKLGGSFWVVKAQIHAGGRGKGGGVKLAASVEEAVAHARAILGMTLVTHQTGPAGRLVKKVLVEEASAIARELYLGVVVDRAAECIVIMGSTEGGVEIEKAAAETPEKIIKVAVDPATGMQPFHARRLAFGLGLTGDLFKPATALMSSLYRAFVELDASLVEINPLIVTQDGRILALDAKLNLDDNALFRHPELAELRDLDEEEPLEIEAGKHHLNYIKLDGEVGCMVNGAGLAMATMDIIKYYGGQPANFLDVGGGATAAKVTAAFKIITSDPQVKAIFVNIFGGIMKCDTIASGVIAAVKEVGLAVPLVVRLEGTNVELGKQLLAESGLDIVAAADMADGAQKVVAAVAARKGGAQ